MTLGKGLEEGVELEVEKTDRISKGKPLVKRTFFLAC